MNKRLAGWLSISVLVVILDQITKLVILSQMSFGQAIPVTSFFQLVLVFNPGAAFSFLANQGGWQRWFFIVLAVIICGWLLVMLRQHQQERALPLAFALIIGGAVGNVIDRIIYGAVVDFLYFHIGRFGWPAFNVADSAITVGVVLMLVSQFWPKRTHPDAETSS